MLAEVYNGTVEPTSETALLSLGLDSLGLARLTSRLHDRFGVLLPPRALYALHTLGDLETALFGGDVRRLAMRAPVVNFAAEAEQEVATLEKEVVALRRLIAEHPAAADSDSRVTDAVVLLTGAAGFIGCFVLAELVRRPNAIVVCFVRGDDNAHARRHSSDASVLLPPPPHRHSTLYHMQLSCPFSQPALAYAS